MEQEDETALQVLRCAECAAESDERALRWRCYIADEDEVVVLCPACASREFDQP